MKKSKKFVLAGLVLLAITGLLALSGCKNDSVPETPAAKLVSITVTPSEGTVYRVGEDVVHKKDGEIGVTAHYDNGTTRTVTGTITTDTSTLTQSAGVQTVTVRYSEGGIGVSGQFEIRVLPKELTDYESPNKTGSEWTYVEFGEWPQNIKADNVFVDESKSKEMGMFTCYLGSDDNYYVKHSDNYYKVEPIVWRVLNKDYASTGKALLLAEKILTGGIPYYVDTSTRTITEKEGSVIVYSNNWQYSTIRAWLNGSYEEKDSQDETYTDKGFLQTAFTESARNLIADTTVDNSATSTFRTGENTQENPYACDKTKDKIFLLSQQEATNSDYGFGAYSESGKGSTRIRVTTDYAKATGANQSSTPGYGGWWWLRSPLYFHSDDARGIYINGYANIDSGVNDTNGGVVPALSISLQ